MEFDGFCAHDWGVAPEYVNHTRVSIIFEELTKLGLTLWFDKVHMIGNIRNQMSQGIENSKCVLVFITNRYQEKVNSLDPNDNCYFEFNFACFRSSKRIIPIVMDKGMLNNKTWKGRLAAELGTHLYVDLTDAIELYELNQKELLHEKCEEIKRRVEIIKADGFDSLTSEEANEFEKLSLENELTWIPNYFFEIMEQEEYYENVIQEMNKISSLLRFKGSRYTVINKLLQSVDFDKILMKIMNMPENLKIMKAFNSILPRADHNLIDTVFTSFIKLLRHIEVHEKFFSLLTESNIHEVIVFILNNKLKCDMENDVQIQLRSKLYLLAIVLSGSPTRQEYFTTELFQENNRLMILSAVKDVGCSVQALKHVGYSLRELQEAGYSANIMKVAGYSAREMKSAGYNAQQLKAAGYSARELMEERSGAGVSNSDFCFTGQEIREAGYTAADLKETGCYAWKLKNFGYSAMEMKFAGYDAQQLKQAGYSARELIEARSGADVSNRDFCFSVQEIGEAGYSVSQLKKAGYNDQELKELGYSASEMKAAGYNAQQLKTAGYSLRELKEAGIFSRKWEIEQAGYSVSELKEAGFTARELREMYYNATELKEACYTARDMKRAGYSAQELKDAAYSARELKEAGYSASEMLAAYYYPYELRDAGFYSPWN